MPLRPMLTAVSLCLPFLSAAGLRQRPPRIPRDPLVWRTPDLVPSDQDHTPQASLRTGYQQCFELASSAASACTISTALMQPHLPYSQRIIMLPKCTNDFEFALQRRRLCVRCHWLRRRRQQRLRGRRRADPNHTPCVASPPAGPAP